MPLDLISGAAAAYGLRRLRKLYNGPLVNVRRSSDNAQRDFYPRRPSGDLPVGDLATFIGGVSGFVTKWYDQSGNVNDLLQATAANQPSISPNVVGGRPALAFASHVIALAGAPSVPAAYSVATVYTHPGGDSVNFTFIMTGADVSDIKQAGATPNTISMTASAILSAAAADGVWHSGQFVFNAAASSITIDGATTSGSTGANSATTSLTINGVGGTMPSMSDAELIVWPSALSAAQVTVISANQRAYYGL